MKPYTLTIRFRETDEYEAEVGAFMRDLSKHTDKSKNRFIIDLIGDYMKRSEQEQQEEAIIEKLRKMIREELQGFRQCPQKAWLLGRVGDSRGCTRREEQVRTDGG